MSKISMIFKIVLNSSRHFQDVSAFSRVFKIFEWQLMRWEEEESAPVYVLAARGGRGVGVGGGEWGEGFGPRGVLSSDFILGLSASGRNLGLERCALKF